MANTKLESILKNRLMFKNSWKKIVVVFASLALVAGVGANFALAQEEVARPVEELSSFELFWPVTAGRTKEDSLYSLKLFKERVRGMVIFGSFKKVDYDIFLTTKRVIEAEALFNSGKQDLANKTLDLAINRLGDAQKRIEKIDATDKAGVIVDRVNNRLNNLEVFLPRLISQNEASRDKLQEILDKVQSLNRNI